MSEPGRRDVGIAFTLIPDGVRRDAADRVFLKFSLAIEPTTEPAAAPKVDLTKWPAEIKIVLDELPSPTSRFKLVAADIGPTDDLTTLLGGGTLSNHGDPVSGIAVTSPRGFEGPAGALWRAQFPEDGTGPSFRDLETALRSRDVGPEKPTQRLNPPLIEFGSYQVAALGRFTDALLASATAATLIARAMARDGVQVTIDGGERIALSPSFDAGLAGTGWWQRSHREWFDLSPPDPALVTLEGLASRLDGREAMVADAAPAAWNVAIEERRQTARNLASIGQARDQGSEAITDLVLTAADVAATATFNRTVALETTRQLAYRRCADLRYWVDGHLAGEPAHSEPGGTARDIAAAVGSQAVKIEIAHCLATWGRGSEAPDEATMVQDEICLPPCQAGRKLLGIHSYPTLASYLRFSADIEIPAGSVFPAMPSMGQRVYRAVTLRVPGSTAETAWTCCVLANRPQAEGGLYFGPAPLDEFRSGYSPDQLYRDGLLNLAPPASGLARFSLRVTSDEQITQAFIHSDPLPIQPPALPTRRTVGIALVDEQHVRHAIVSETHERARDAMSSNETVLFCDHLVAGYRPDVLVSRHRQPTPADMLGRWRSLVARDVEYAAMDVDPGYVDAIGDALREHRDDGHVRALLEIRDSNQGIDQQPVPKVFVWTGEGLGAPGLHQQFDEDGQPADPNESLRQVTVSNDDLTVGLSFAAPAGSGADGVDRRPAPLRIGLRHLFGARLMLMNGCGLTLKEARELYSGHEKPTTLGESATKTFLLPRYDPIEAPSVLLPWDAPLVTEELNDPDPEEPSDPNPTAASAAIRGLLGETLETLVVRTGSHATHVNRRFAVPARVDFDTAEASGLFDPDPPSRVRGAFVGDAARAIFDKELGTFPIARKGNWSTQYGDTSGAPGRNGTEDQAEPSRGNVLVLHSGSQAAKVAYFPDSWAKRVAVGFTRNDAPAGLAYGARGPLEFWSGNASPVDAKPILIELQRVPRNPRQPRAWFVTSDREAAIKPFSGSRRVTVPKLAIALQPAEEVDLDLWSLPDGRTMIAQHGSIREALAAIRSLPDLASPRSESPTLDGLTDPAKSAEVLEVLLGAAPARQVQTLRRLRLVHAVEKPLAKPRFVDRSDRPQLHAVAIVDAQEGSEADPGRRNRWADYVEAHKEVDPLDWPSEAGGTHVFLVGEIAADRLSTGRMRIDASWDEWRAGSYSWDERSRLWSARPDPGYGSFAVDDIACRDEIRNRPILLLYDDNPEPGLRSVSLRFTDGRARRLRLRLRATSRFTAYFPASPSEDGRCPPGGSLPPYELCDEQHGTAGAWLWVPATERPKPPVIDCILPTFRMECRSIAGGVVFTRSAIVRVRIDPREETWCEGERLGIVFDESSLADECDIDTGENQPFAEAVTRWGADPIHLSGPIAQRIPPAAFGGLPVRCRELLTTGAAEGDRRGAAVTPDRQAMEGVREVTVLSYAPIFDLREGLHCDIPVDHGPSYFPFLRLGLVRHQPHSILGLAISGAVPAWVQLPPKREGRVAFTSGRGLVLELHGIGFFESGTTGAVAADLPLINVELVRASRRRERRNAHGHWIPVFDEAGMPLRQEMVAPIRRGEEVWWAVQIRLPRDRDEVHYGIRIEEVERIAQDDVAMSAGPYEGAGTLVTRMLFETVVDLDPDKSARNADTAPTGGDADAVELQSSQE